MKENKFDQNNLKQFSDNPVGQVLVVRVDIGVVIYEAMTPQCGRSVVQVLIVTVDIEVVTYKAITLQCGRSVVQALVVTVDIGVMIYEAMPPQHRRSVDQVLVVRVDIGVVIYLSYDTPVWQVRGLGPGCQSGYRSDDLCSYDTPVWEVSGFGPGCQGIIGVLTYEAMTTQCGRLVVQILVVRVDIGVATL